MFKNKCTNIDIVRLRWCHSMQSTLSSSCIQFYSKKWRGRFSKIFEDMLFLKKKFGKTLVLQSKFFTILNGFDWELKVSWFLKVFLVFSFLPKNKRKQVDLHFFHSFFWKNWRHQKYISKLADLYWNQSTSVRTMIILKVFCKELIPLKKSHSMLNEWHILQK